MRTDPGTFSVGTHMGNHPEILVSFCSLKKHCCFFELSTHVPLYILFYGLINCSTIK